MNITREGTEKKVAWLSIWSNVILTTSKILIGWYAASGALLADGIHSAADVFASVIVLLVIGLANKPADEQHPYGHGKAEVIISGIVGIMLFIIALYIIYEAIHNLFVPITESPKWIAVIIALISYIAKLWLYRSSLKIAKVQKSKAIEAIAYDHKADISASLAAAIGIVLAIVGELLHIQWLLYSDIIASILVSFFILKIAIDMLREAFHILMESNISTEQLEEFRRIISAFPDVRRIDRLRAREHGHYLIIDLRISIDHQMTIKEGHDLGKAIKTKIQEDNDHVQEVLIHLNPYFGEQHK